MTSQIFSAVIETEFEGVSNEVFVEIEKVFQKKGYTLLSISENKKVHKNKTTSFTYNIKVDVYFTKLSIGLFIGKFTNFVFSEVSYK